MTRCPTCHVQLIAPLSGLGGRFAPFCPRCGKGYPEAIHAYR